jgi:hypothetical protein
MSKVVLNNDMKLGTGMGREWVCTIVTILLFQSICNATITIHKMTTCPPAPT